MTMLQAGSRSIKAWGLGLLRKSCREAEIMKLSNLLKEYSSKLRIKESPVKRGVGSHTLSASAPERGSQEHDELDACSQKTPDWEKEVIMTPGGSLPGCGRTVLPGGLGARNRKPF